ncbi:MAG: cyanoexosortase B system-associated protein [Cyanobacteria bacterium P01_F01_bin.150]
MVNWVRGKIHSSSAPIWLAIGLLAIATVTVLPNYVTGQWAWTQSPTLEPTKVLKTFHQQGISLAGWQELDQQTIELGHKKWSVQALSLLADDEVNKQDGVNKQDETIHSGSSQAKVVSTLKNYGLTNLPDEVTNRLQEDPIFIFLRPQSNAKDEPLVEWIDLGGLQRWTTDQRKSVRIKIPQPSNVLSKQDFPKQNSQTKESQILTRYFRGWNQHHTYAVMQWYAWPNGGSPRISDWFWADQKIQWQTHQRMPWVGVTLLVPIKPLGDIASMQPVVEAIAQAIQTTLVQAIAPAPPSSG